MIVVIDCTALDLADGTYDISLKITDKAGNETELTQEIVIDSVAPRATYTYHIDRKALKEILQR